MTLANRDATSAYLHALNDMPNTKPNCLARMADRMAGQAFDQKMPDNINPVWPDSMMSIETAIFTALCAANAVNWRYLKGEKP